MSILSRHWFAQLRYFPQKMWFHCKVEKLSCLFHLGGSFLKPNKSIPLEIAIPKRARVPFNEQDLNNFSVSFGWIWAVTLTSFDFILTYNNPIISILPWAKLSFIPSCIKGSWLQISTMNLAETLLACALHKISIQEQRQIKETIINCELSAGRLSGSWLITPLILAKTVS